MSDKIINNFLALVTAVYNNFLVKKKSTLSKIKITTGNSEPYDLWIDIKYAKSIYYILYLSSTEFFI